MKENDMNILQAHEIAIAAAKDAANKYFQQYGDRDACGFSWVKANIDGRTKIARELKKVGFDRAWNYGYDFWNPSKMPVQSISVLEKGSYAYAEKMNELLETDVFFAQSRMD